MNVAVDREEEGIPEDIEKEARSMGWVPEAEFKGKNWVDAEEFVERGRVVMPILLNNNRRLQKELLTRDTKIGTLEQQLQGAQKAIEKLEKHYTETNKRAVEIARAQLKEELKQAREENDVDREMQITDQLADLKQRETEAAKEPVAPTPENKPVQGKYTPDFQEWIDRNPWFGKDAKTSRRFGIIAEELREEGTELQGPEFLDECVRLYEEEFGPIYPEQEEQEPVRRQSSKVEGVSNRRRARSNGHSYADLPAEAKAACNDDADDLVGPGKRYATLKDWQAAYAKIYYAEE